MKRHDTESVSWTARFGDLQAAVVRYRCRGCQTQRRPLLDLLGVEPGRISGSLARLLADRGALVGVADVRNYDGSWTEWGNLVGAPIERGS